MFLMWIVPLMVIMLVMAAIYAIQLSPALKPAAVRVCAHCGQAVEGDWKNCPQCGQRL
jgi:rubrerythrin